MISTEDALLLASYAERVPGRLLTDAEFKELDELLTRTKWNLGIPLTEYVTTTNLENAS